MFWLETKLPLGQVSKVYECALICPSAICISGSHNPLQRMKKQVGGFVDACEKKYFFWGKLWFGILVGGLFWFCFFSITFFSSENYYFLLENGV